MLELLGEGGLGTVYLAQQREPVRRHSEPPEARQVDTGVRLARPIHGDD